MKPEVLTRLLRGEHLNMEVRIAIGAWPHPPITTADVVEHLAAVLQHEDWFPRRPDRDSDSHTIHEGGVIECRGAHDFVYRKRRADPVLAEETEQLFTNARAVAEFYLRWDLGLPGDLDGWKVIE